MKEINPLKEKLNEHFQWNQARIAFLANFLVALISKETVNLVKIAKAFKGTSKPESSYKRIKRFLRSFSMDFEAVSKFLASFLPSDEKWLLCLDRTNWKFGKLDINILMLAVARKGVAIPLFWTFLGKRGNSNTQERIEIMERFLKVFGKDKIDCLTADREFVGAVWTAFLKNSGVPFRIRTKKDSLVPNAAGSRLMRIELLFRGLRVGEAMILRKPRTVFGLELWVVALRIRGDYVFLLTDENPGSALEDYKKRWEIETLFGCLKTRGFNLEDTHLQEYERISKLLALISIAFCWSHALGEWIVEAKPIKLKKHGRKAISVFRCGLDYLVNVFFNLVYKTQEFIFALKFLSRT